MTALCLIENHQMDQATESDGMIMYRKIYMAMNVLNIRGQPIWMNSFVLFCCQSILKPAFELFYDKFERCLFKEKTIHLNV